MKTIKTWSNIIATWVAIFSAIAGGVFASCQYKHNLAAEKVKETLKYVERFNSGQVHKARWQIEKDIERHIPDFKRPDIKGVKAFSTLDFIRREGLSDSADTVIEFFDELYICTYSKICDEETTKSFFGGYNVKLWDIFHAFIMNKRQLLENNEIGCGIENIAKSYREQMPISAISCSATYSK